MYRDALYAASVSPEAVQSGKGLTLPKLDQVLLQLRRDVPGITLDLFSTIALMDLGLVGYAAASAENVGKALRLVYQYHELTSDRFRPVIEVRGEFAHIVPVVGESFASEFRDIAEDHVAGSWNLICQLLGSRANVREITVRLAYSAPSYSSTYERIFGGQGRFDEEQTEMVFPSAWLDHPVATANPEIGLLANTVCERLLGPASRRTDTVSSVRSLLLSRPGRTMLGVAAAAKALNFSTDQLRKRLWRHGSSYKQLVLEARMMLARNYLEATTLNVQEIAFLLDYSQPGAFSRAFKKYYGIAPLKCREFAQNVPSPSHSGRASSSRISNKRGYLR